MLLGHGADAEAKNEVWLVASLVRVAPGWSSERRHPPSRLRTAGSRTSKRSQFRSTALVLACCGGHTELAALLVDHGANVNTVGQVRQPSSARCSSSHLPDRPENWAELPGARSFRASWLLPLLPSLLQSPMPMTRFPPAGQLYCTAFRELARPRADRSLAVGSWRRSRRQGKCEFSPAGWPGQSRRRHAHLQMMASPRCPSIQPKRRIRRCTASSQSDLLTAFHVACKKGNTAMAKLLLDHGADVNTCARVSWPTECPMGRGQGGTIAVRFAWWSAAWVHGADPLEVAAGRQRLTAHGRVSIALTGWAPSHGACLREWLRRACGAAPGSGSQ